MAFFLHRLRDYFYITNIKIQLSTRTSDSIIYFTLDNTDPDSTSQEYDGNISSAGDTNIITFKAFTISNRTDESLISSATYIIDYEAPLSSNHIRPQVITASLYKNVTQVFLLPSIPYNNRNEKASFNMHNS